MLKLATITISLALASPAIAGVTCNTIGQFTYCNDAASGYNSTTNRIGNFDYTNESYGNGHHRQTTCNTIGQFTYCD